MAEECHLLWTAQWGGESRPAGTPHQRTAVESPAQHLMSTGCVENHWVSDRMQNASFLVLYRMLGGVHVLSNLLVTWHALVFKAMRGGAALTARRMPCW